MGIQDLYSIIEEHAPGSMVTVPLSSLCGWRIAVDISIFFYKFIRSSGPKKWVDSFILFLCCLKKHGIKPVCIFDGPNPPPEKAIEQQRRRGETQKLLEKKKQAEAYLRTVNHKYLSKPNTHELDLEPDFREELEAFFKGKGHKQSTVNFDDVHDVAAALKNKINTLTLQTFPILPEYTDHAIEIINIMGFVHIKAYGEAETLCAALCTSGKVDGVLTEDTDVLPYGTNFALTRLDMYKETVCRISFEDLTTELQLSPFEFRDLCILLSCDYNDRVKGYPPDGRNRKKPIGIGAKGAWSMITEYRVLEEVENYLEDASPLRYRRCRELFTPPPVLEFAVPFNHPIDATKLTEFLERFECKIGVSYILGTWKPVTLKFTSINLKAIEEELDAELNAIEGEDPTGE